MKAFALFVSLFISVASFAKEPITKDGYCKGKKLCGFVRVVDKQVPDFYVFVEEVLTPDVDVRVVNYSSSSVGDWMFVDHKVVPNFTIKYVKSKAQADFTIRIVKHSGGVRFTK